MTISNLDSTFLECKKNLNYEAFGTFFICSFHSRTQKAYFWQGHKDIPKPKDTFYLQYSYSLSLVLCNHRGSFGTFALMDLAANSSSRSPENVLAQQAVKKLPFTTWDLDTYFQTYKNVKFAVMSCTILEAKHFYLTSALARLNISQRLDTHAVKILLFLDS